MPKWLNTLSSTLNVPPYTFFEMITLSPVSKRLKTAVMAAMPEPNANPAFPPSSSAISASSAALVGLPVLEYS